MFQVHTKLTKISVQYILDIMFFDNRWADKRF